MVWSRRQILLVRTIGKTKLYQRSLGLSNIIYPYMIMVHFGYLIWGKWESKKIKARLRMLKIMIERFEEISAFTRLNEFNYYGHGLHS